MKLLNVREVFSGFQGWISAAELVDRSKSFPPVPPVLIIKKIEQGKYQILKVEKALFQDLNVEVSLEAGEILTVPHNVRFQVWKEPGSK